MLSPFFPLDLNFLITQSVWFLKFVTIWSTLYNNALHVIEWVVESFPVCYGYHVTIFFHDYQVATVTIKSSLWMTSWEFKRGLVFGGYDSAHWKMEWITTWIVRTPSYVAVLWVVPGTTQSAHLITNKGNTDDLLNHSCSRLLLQIKIFVSFLCT